MTPVRRVLVANRGEIACRIFETAHRMGLETVAVYSDADADAKHVRMAGRSRRIGVPQAAGSYLRQDRIIEAALETGADAIHPGYGFLSENAAFALSVKKAGLKFIGPSSEAIALMGSKSRAKTKVAKAGVPVVPGYAGRAQDFKSLEAAAAKVGYPLLIKASAGGGGKGMRIVHSAKELRESLDSARREAKSAFGEGRLILERYLKRARHIEVQIFGDEEGNVVHLFERDCSVQRRHQKVIEEAPAPGLSSRVRQSLFDAAVTAARSIGYVGAGTVEFLVSGEELFFIEMNTRLQVEHPVTEAVTGVDLVEWQFHIASGEPLPLIQDEIACHGHAIEARLYAEDPDRDFAPQAGEIWHACLPSNENVRVDAGFAGRTTVSPDYDPMIAKVIACGDSRDSARNRLIDALNATELAGVRTNLAFLGNVLRTDAFRKGAIDTGWLDRKGTKALVRDSQDSKAVHAVAAAALHVIDGYAPCAPEAEPSPWVVADAWRMNAASRYRVLLRNLQEGGEVIEVVLTRLGPESYEMTGYGPTQTIKTVERGLLFNGHEVPRKAVSSGDDIAVFLFPGTFAFKRWQSSVRSNDGPLGISENVLRAPMPGRITSIETRKGERVQDGQTLVLMEAMKMEHPICAPFPGTVREIVCKVGEQIDAGAGVVLLDR